MLKKKVDLLIHSLNFLSTFKGGFMKALFLVMLFIPIALSNNALYFDLKEDTRIEVEIKELAIANGFSPNTRLINAIAKASDIFEIDALELTAIAIIETGLGTNVVARKNKNGTIDRGLFQINSVNHKECIEYDLDSYEGSSLCAAKILSRIKMSRKDYLGVYHSKTKHLKAAYIEKVERILKNN